MALTTINSGGVKDDSIVNADIKSDAAIALSKLASTPAVLTGSTNNTIVTVTGANAITGEASLTYNGTDALSIDHSATNENSYIKIAADDNRRKTLVFDSGGTTRGVIGIGDSDEASATSLFLSANSNVAGNSPHLVIDSSGNIGQGTATPLTPNGSVVDNPLNGTTTVFTMYGDSPAINLISSTTTSDDWSLINFGRTGSTSNPYRAVIGYHQSADTLRINANNAITFDVGGAINTSERLRITSDGKVGIGTTSPSELLQIGNDSGTPGGLKIAGQSSSVTDEGLTIDWTSSNEARLFSESSGDATMHFYTTSSGTRGERLRINSSGNVSIGGIAPVATDAAYNKALLHIHQTQSGTYGSEIHLTNNTTGSTATDGMFLSMWSDSDVYFTNQESGDINFTTNGHEAFKIQSNKNVKITDGNLIIDTSGHGIDFSATSGTGTSELLDDYEEGTWSPTVSSGGTAFTVSGTRYVKIGAQVTLWFDITNGSGSGTSNIYGLPFTPTNVHGNWNIGYYEVGNATTSEDPTHHGGFVDYGTPRLSCRVPGGSVGWTIADSTRLIGCAVYWTTD